MRQRILTKSICSLILVMLFIMCVIFSGNAQETIQLWEGKAPGSENWDHKEKTSSFPGGGSIVQNVVDPTITAYLPDPSRIGIMGFSAGGGVAVGTALLDDPEGYPDFVVSLYGPSMVDVHVPANAPPLFIAVAANHKPVSMGCVALYSVWNEAGKSAELHVFSKGAGPFSMRSQGLPSDAWPNLFLDWIKGEGLI